MEENNRIADTWRLKNRAMSIDNINLATCSGALNVEQHYQQLQMLQQHQQQQQQQVQHAPHSPQGNKENHSELKHGEQEAGVQPQLLDTTGLGEQGEPQEEEREDNDNIIPWRAQLRKTNSRLSLI